MQILENTRNPSQRITVGEVQAALVQTCNAWDDWVSDTRHHYDPMKPHAFQDDSGIELERVRAVGSGLGRNLWPTMF